MPGEGTLNLDNCIQVLGGRMKDLEGLAMCVSPDGLASFLSWLTIDALKDIIDQASSE